MQGFKWVRRESFYFLFWKDPIDPISFSFPFHNVMHGPQRFRVLKECLANSSYVYIQSCSKLPQNAKLSHGAFFLTPFSPSFPLLPPSSPSHYSLLRLSPISSSLASILRTHNLSNSGICIRSFAGGYFILFF